MNCVRGGFASFPLSLCSYLNWMLLSKGSCEQFSTNIRHSNDSRLFIIALCCWKLWTERMRIQEKNRFRLFGCVCVYYNNLIEWNGSRALWFLVCLYIFSAVYCVSRTPNISHLKRFLHSPIDFYSSCAWICNWLSWWYFVLPVFRLVLHVNERQHKLHLVDYFRVVLLCIIRINNNTTLTWTKREKKRANQSKKNWKFVRCGNKICHQSQRCAWFQWNYTLIYVFGQ